MLRRLDLLLPGLFLFCAGPLLLFLAMAVPTGEVPDEVAHIVRMESVLHGVIVGRRVPRLDMGGQPTTDSAVRANAALLAAGFTFTPGTPVGERKLTQARVEQLESLIWEAGTTRVNVTNTAVYAPLFYVPGAIGMQLAKWSDAGPWSAILAARTMNAAVYVALGLVALLVARRVRGLLFATLCLPMSLWLAASCNQDGLVIGTACLCAALLTRGSLRAWWGAVLCLALLVVAKPLYLPLTGVLIALAPVRRPALGLRAAGLLCVAVPAVGWYILAQVKAAAPFVRGVPFKPGPYWPGNPDQVFGAVDAANQVRVVLAHPLLLVRLPLELLWGSGDWLAWQAIGLLGTLDILMPAGAYVLWIAALGALVVGEACGATRPRPGVIGWAGALIVGSVCATVFALCDGQYLSWTYTGAAAIEGVQGRYFVPLLPFAALALPALAVPGARGLRWALRLPMLAAVAYGVTFIPALVVTIYYLR